MRPVTIEVRKQGPVAILDLSGEVRIGEPTTLLREKSKELLAQGERYFVLNLIDVPWLDSSGIGEIFAMLKRAREVGGSVRLVLRGKPASLFAITRLDRVFEIFDDVEAALVGFAPA